MNTIKDRLKAGKAVVGTAGSVSEENMALLADSGLDFLLFDTQHSFIEPKQYQRAIAAMKGKPAAPIMRVSENRPDLICFALDLGVRGVIVPMVNTKEEATAMVRACKYSPDGDRSLLRESIHIQTLTNFFWNEKMLRLFRSVFLP